MSDKDSRTEQATGKRQWEARQEGRIARSPDLVSWTAIFVGLTLLQRTVGNSAELCQQLLEDMGRLIAAPDEYRALQFLGDALKRTAIAVAPLALGFIVLSVAGHLAQIRFLFTTKPMKPKLSKLNPITGLKGLLSPQSTFQAAKQIVKTIVLGYIAYRTLWDTMTGLAEGGPYAITEVMRLTANAVITFIKQGALAGIVIGLIDYAYSRRKTREGMKMTKQEVKEESKQQEVNPEVKRKLAMKQRQMSQNRMMAAIKDADVVVVNPVHVAVALKYDPVAGAPKVLATGAGFVAEKIRERADEHKIPLVQDIPLARTLHRTCGIGDEIPAEMFEAVARVLAFVFALRARGTGSGFHRMPGSPDLAEADAAEAREKALIEQGNLAVT